MMNAGYQIEMKEKYKSEGNRDFYIALGQMDTKYGRKYVTWEAVNTIGVGDWSFFWGHYFDNKHAALYSYHNRLAEEYDYMD